MSDISAIENPPTRVNDSPEYLRGADWKFAALGGLAEPSARRIFTAAEFHLFVQKYRPGASPSTARSTAEIMVSAGALRRVSSGVFLNRRKVPPTELSEVAPLMRSGAVVSLHSVLGECGFLNNPSAIVMAVLPTSAAKRPRLGEVKTSAGDVFRFYGLAERFFPQTNEDRWAMLQPGRPNETFRPEAALLQWLHLAGMQRSSLTMPPADVDMEALDLELLNRLAAQWKLLPALVAFTGRNEMLGYGEEREPGQVVTHNESPQDALAASAAARERMMARKKGAF
jgi:hypothetical protein